MEEKINIAKILKDKPQGTKLYSILSDGECFLNEVSEDSIYIDIDNRKRFWCFTVYGSTHSFPNGCVLLFPSREMRNWRKFNWKKGDVLVSNDGKVEVIFEKFEGDTYQSFIGKHHLGSLDENLYYQDGGVYSTARFNIETEDAAQTYIKTIEEKLDGKLNRETLEIEKAQPEFKDGDIVVTDAVPSLCYSKCIFILNGDLNTNENSANSYVFYNINNNRISFDVLVTTIRCSNIRLATEEEKKQLFSALKKKGKVWDSEHKMIVDLPKKCEFKPFDKVVVRDTEYSTWCADLFSHIDEDYRYACVGATWSFCIPYNEETAKLIGTTNNVEG